MAEFQPTAQHAHGLYVVIASRDSEKQLWVAFQTPQVALAQVLQRLPPGWFVTLSGDILTPKEAKILGIQPNEVRKLRDSL